MGYIKSSLEKGFQCLVGPRRKKGQEKVTTLEKHPQFDQGRTVLGGTGRLPVSLPYMDWLVGRWQWEFPHVVSLKVKRGSEGWSCCSPYLIDYRLGRVFFCLLIGHYSYSTYKMAYANEAIPILVTSIMPYSTHVVLVSPWFQCLERWGEGDNHDWTIGLSWGVHYHLLITHGPRSFGTLRALTHLIPTTCHGR